MARKYRSRSRSRSRRRRSRSFRRSKCRRVGSKSFCRISSRGRKLFYTPGCRGFIRSPKRGKYTRMICRGAPYAGGMYPSYKPPVFSMKPRSPLKLGYKPSPLMLGYKPSPLMLEYKPSSVVPSRVSSAPKYLFSPKSVGRYATSAPYIPARAASPKSRGPSGIEELF